MQNRHLKHKHNFVLSIFNQKDVPIPAAAEQVAYYAMHGELVASQNGIQVEPNFSSMSSAKLGQLYRSKFACPHMLDADTRFNCIIEELSFRYGFDNDSIKALYDTKITFIDFCSHFKSPYAVREIHSYWGINFVFVKFKLAGFEEVPNLISYKNSQLEAEFQKLGINLDIKTYRNHFIIREKKIARPKKRPREETQVCSTQTIFKSLHPETEPRVPSPKSTDFLDDETILANLLATASDEPARDVTDFYPDDLENPEDPVQHSTTSPFQNR